MSKMSTPRALIYLLALFPGLFFLSSVAVGNPQLARTTIEGIKGIYPFASYALVVIFVGTGFVFGQGLVLSAWLAELVIFSAVRLPRIAYRGLFGSNWLYKWFAKRQGTPPSTNRAVRALGKMIFLARSVPTDSTDAKAVRFCLAAATESLLKSKYGIGAQRASGPNGGEWQVWYSVMGKPLRSLVETRNVARITLACGLAGFLAMLIEPRLIDRYYIGLISVFTFCGFWTPCWIFFQVRNPIRADVLRLQAVLTELEGFSSSADKAEPRKVN